jgi:H+/gluconate symporter-like permease
LFVSRCIFLLGHIPGVILSVTGAITRITRVKK